MVSLERYADWRTWWRGIIGAAVGGGANAITLMVIKPEHFNFSKGWPDLWHFAVISSVVSGALYLKQHPVPELKTNPPFPLNEK